ncbi:hypothetical protein [Mucilaginibacter ginsenosidivorans]|uniref:PE-PGRS family protein n=1 Tax=Mucilaginibacter ginsenosidivorans TaxID=398053 RepID=A0A5B8UPN3_9SPHI|nr:hypothetical protein [Mucilaginibacter ginsenosidivorans]QEC61057.1 hypothetical protein FRZ54_00165 [Mucilaginibacter ginsenosidivorans]
MTTRFSKNIMRYFVRGGLLCFLFFSFFSCKKASITAPKTTDTVAKTPVVFTTPTYDPLLLDTSKAFESAPIVNDLARTDLVEISGIAASRINPGILYIHNDSGNPNQVYLTDATGGDKGTLTLTPVSDRDWEDIAVGPGPIAGKSYVYVAEIGDNDSKYKSVFVYRFAEPDLTGKTLPLRLNIDTVDILELKYPDGPRNAETLMVDPSTRDIYIASKESNASKIYVAHYPQSTTSATVMEPVVKLLFNKATGGDISPDGSEILLRSKELIWYWKLPAGTSISAGLMTKPEHAPYANNEPQGEGIGFAADGSGYYTDTEVRDYPGMPATISFYKRK